MTSSPRMLAIAAARHLLRNNAWPWIAFVFVMQPFFSYRVSAELVSAYDDSSQLAYASNTFINADGGLGFGPWTAAYSSGSGGTYMAGTSGLSSTKSFAIYAGGGPGNSYGVSRSFDQPLAIGATFSLDLGYTGIDSGGEIGLALFSSGAYRLGLKFVNGQSSWLLNDGATDFSTGLTWAGGSPGTPLEFSFTRGSGNQYSISLLSGAQSFTGSDYTATSGTMSIDSFQFYSNAQGVSQNIAIDNLQVVPEPDSFMVIGAGLALACVRRLTAGRRPA